MSNVEIDGQSYPLERVSSVEELSDFVVRSRSAGEAIFPLGGATMLGLGMVPDRSGRAVDLRGLTTVADYPARDMTITVQAGITIAELRRLLSTEQQRLPIDVPHAQMATLGGTLAANVSGLRRVGWGTLRDYLIGITVINDEGKQVKAGGRVVKNVAGYDMCKLYIGSLGTLGIITQATLKVVPQPEQHALVTFACLENSLVDLLDRVHQSRTRPVATEMLNPPAVHWVSQRIGVEFPPDRWLVAVGYESNADAVNWQVQQLVKEVKTGYSLEARVGPTAAPLWEALEELPAWAEAAWTIKAAMLPGRCPAFCQRLALLAPDAILQAHAGNGIVLAHLGHETSAEQAMRLIGQCRDDASTAASVVVVRCPPEWKRTLSVWGPARGDARLMRKVKEKLDPDRLFNPGRFVDGI